MESMEIFNEVEEGTTSVRQQELLPETLSAEIYAVERVGYDGVTHTRRIEAPNFEVGVFGEKENSSISTCSKGEGKAVSKEDGVMATIMNDVPGNQDREECPIVANAKGKELVRDDSTMNVALEFKEELPPDEEMCGICLSGTENEKGMLDCCNHIFCHECIMTWARKETSCPLCKQRFVTITVMKKADSSISQSLENQKTSFRLPQRNLLDDPQGNRRNFQLAITKREPRHLNLFIHEAVERYKEAPQDLNLKLKLRVELMCGRCGSIFLDQTLDVNVGRNVRLPLDDWPWACDECILECENAESEVIGTDWDFDFDVQGLPHMRMSEGACKNLGLTTLITMSRRSKELSCSSPNSYRAREASTSSTESLPDQVISFPSQSTVHVYETRME